MAAPRTSESGEPDNNLADNEGRHDKLTISANTLPHTESSTCSKNHSRSQQIMNSSITTKYSTPTTQHLTALLCLQVLAIYLFLHLSRPPSLQAAAQCQQLADSHLCHAADLTKSTVSLEQLSKQTDYLFLWAACPTLAFPCMHQTLLPPRCQRQ